MSAEEELIFILIKSQQRQSHQRRFVQDKAPVPISFDERLQPAFTFSSWQRSPILFRHRHIDVAVNALQRLLEIFPEKSGAQDRVSLHHAFPGLFECSHIQLAFDREE
mgnify:CR=1 FL=1